MERVKRTIEEKKELISMLDEARKTRGSFMKACAELGISNVVYYDWKKKFGNNTVKSKKPKKLVGLNDFDTYVVNNFMTEGASEISKKLGVNLHSVNGAMNRLNKAGIIDSSKSFNRANKHNNRVTIKKGYSNECGIGKGNVRDVACELISLNENTKPRILTLPASKWIWEKQLLKKRPCSKFVAVELDKNTFIEMNRNYLADDSLTKAVVSINNCTMGEMIRKSDENEFDHAILDYCGTINTFYNEINEALEKNIVKKDGLIIITLSKNGFHNDSGVIKQFLTAMPIKELNFSDAESVYATKGLIGHLIVKNSFRYKIERVIEYSDTSGMIVFMLKRLS